MPHGTLGSSPDTRPRRRTRTRHGTDAGHRPIVEDPTTLMAASTLLPIIPLAGIIAILFAIYLARDVLARDTGTPEMQAVAGTIYEGAVAFIRRQYTTIAIIAVFGAVIIGAIITLVETKDVAVELIYWFPPNFVKQSGITSII
jgi:hypothetical protein